MKPPASREAEIYAQIARDKQREQQRAESLETMRRLYAQPTQHEGRPERMTASDRIRDARELAELETPAIVAELAAIAGAHIVDGQAIPYSPETLARRGALSRELDRRNDDERRAAEGDEQRDYAEERANAAELEAEHRDAIAEHHGASIAADVLETLEHEEHYAPPAELAGTVFDPSSETFGPIMAAIQRGDFADAAAALLDLEAATTPDPIAARLEELRAELRAERISYGELAELADLAEHIEPGDLELLEAAGVPEFDDDEPETLTIADMTAGELAELARRHVATSPGIVAELARRLKELEQLADSELATIAGAVNVTRDEQRRAAFEAVATLLRTNSPTRRRIVRRLEAGQ